VEPWGELRADFRAGQICTTVASYAGKMRSEQAPPVNPADFMPALGEGRDTHAKPANSPVLIKNPAEHARLLRKILFKKDV
jgi:hypothetical protein